jgi:hypothetical protein
MMVTSPLAQHRLQVFSMISIILHFCDPGDPIYPIKFSVFIIIEFFEKIIKQDIAVFLSLVNVFVLVIVL